MLLLSSDSAPAPVLTPRHHLEGGFAYELAGVTARAIAAYEAALSAGADLQERAEAHLRLARAHRSLSDWDAAVREARESVRLAEELGSDDLVAEAMNAEVGVYQLRGDFESGEMLALQALARARSPRVRGILLQNRGAMAAQRSDFAGAERLFCESVAAFRDAGYELGMAVALNNASAAARDAGDCERAVHIAREAAELARELGALDVLVLAVQNEAHALAKLSRTDEAEALINNALGHFADTKNVLRQAECLEILGTLYALKPEYQDPATRCFELARVLADRVGARVLYERLTDRLASHASVHSPSSTPLPTTSHH